MLSFHRALWVAVSRARREQSVDPANLREHYYYPPRFWCISPGSEPGDCVTSELLHLWEFLETSNRGVAAPERRYILAQVPRNPAVASQASFPVGRSRSSIASSGQRQAHSLAPWLSFYPCGFTDAPCLVELWIILIPSSRL